LVKGKSFEALQAIKARGFAEVTGRLHGLLQPAQPREQARGLLAKEVQFNESQFERKYTFHISDFFRLPEGGVKRLTRGFKFADVHSCKAEVLKGDAAASFVANGFRQFGRQCGMMHGG